MGIKLTRRKFVKKGAVVTAGAIVVSGLPPVFIKAAAAFDDKPQFELPKLGYEYNALEPYIDEKTMQIHHSKHHQAYIDKLNKALADAGESGISLDELVKNISKYPAAVRNNGGGHWNHSLFWKLMKPAVSFINDPDKKNMMKAPESPEGTFANAIKEQFGTMDVLREKFSDAAKSVFGSGWAWLVVNKDKKLEIGTTPNQDNPLMDVSVFKGTPVLALDVWEHAYYLKHQNLRADYIKDWWNLVNWGYSKKLYDEAIKQ